MILTYLLFSGFASFSQNTAHLILDLDFRVIKEEKQQINGVLDLKGRFYSIRHGHLETDIPTGTLQGKVKINIPGQDLWEKDLEVTGTSSDTTRIEVLIPDHLLPHFNRIAFISDTGTYFPQILKDTLNCRDDKGLKQGLWFRQWNNLGNCIDEMFMEYQLYRNDTLHYAIKFHYDYNICVINDHRIDLIRYKKNGKYKEDGKQVDMGIYCSIERKVSVEGTPGVSSGFDHNQVSHNDVKGLLAQFIRQGWNLRDIRFFEEKGLHGWGEVSDANKTMGISF